MSKKIARGILQGDSLSPLLFVLCMDPLSRQLNEKYPKVTVQTDAESHSTNHLLFIDDLKLFAKDGSTLRIFKKIGLEINKEKSDTDDTCCYDTATLLEGVSVYKYLGIIEDCRGIPTRSAFEEVQSKLISRVERLCHTRLNAKNLFSAINQHAISLINYYIGVLRLEPADFSKLDDAVLAVLVKNMIHLRPGCKKRLYLPRTELGRGLHSVELRSEHMLLQLLDCLEKITKKSLEEAQLAKLYNEIEKRKLHSKLYKARKNELVSVSDSSRWLKSGNIRTRNEAVFCYIQDRDVFWGTDSMGQHCNKSGKTVDHLASRCEKMLGHDYTRRHNEVEILDNLYAEIGMETRIKVEVKIRNNRPDIFILDKKKNMITLREVKITSQKYGLLTNELGLIYKCSVKIIPYVMTWDCIVTKYHKSHLKRLEIPMNVEAYNLSIVLKKMVETISFDRIRGLEASMGVIKRSRMHEEPITPLKEAKREEDGTTLEEPTNNINEESDLEKETAVVKEVEENIKKW
ncbi:reverse transcriptase [Hamiltosporidium tvaerminnensis]|uniref:Reverse transcriptase n=1 Tax=Hamiltosporidium tvaerminnensis TaxID=1176355 RepID=A0A4Q9LIN0_9MICR|nr:reverse transcriptase [Hamiltosporidium tvaerminnensis]